MYKLEYDLECDGEYYHELMDKRIISSKEAKDIYHELLREDALPQLGNNFDWARLCIAYCFARNITFTVNEINHSTTTKGGMEIPSFKTMFGEYSRFWLVFLSEHLFEIHQDKPITKDDLYNYIYVLWDTGAFKLKEFWLECKKFKAHSILEAKQTFLDDLAKIALKNSQSRIEQNTHMNDADGTSQNPETDLEKLKHALAKSGLPNVLQCQLEGVGVRYHRFLVQFSAYADIIKKKQMLCSELGMAENHLRISPCVGQGLSNTLYIDLLRPEQQWQYFGQDAFKQAIADYQPLNRKDELPIIIGLDEMGQAQYQDLATCNHILVAGKTGAGKSVLIRTLLGSLFALNDSDTVNVAILDPKQGVDYAGYKELPQLWDKKFITNIADISDTLMEISEEMEARDRERAFHNATKLSDIPKANRPPYLIVVIDEVADLLDTDPEIETSIMRLTQRGRASGIFVILATQSPDSKTLTTRLRANLATRIALSVATARASTTILDETGAENLIGKGDHLVKWLGKDAQFLHGYDV